MNYPVYIIAMLACVIGSAYFSATETAFSSLNKTRIKTLAEDGHKRAKLVLKLSNDYDRLISTILIGNNIVNILAASLGTLMFVKLLGEDIGATVSTVVVTVVVLIFGEISPKSIAKDFPEKFAMFSAPIIQFLIWILTPLNFLFWLWKKFLSLFLKKKDDEKLSQAELLMFVEEVQEGGSIDTNEGHLLRNAIEFGDLKAEDILTHRVDLEALPVDATPEEVAEQFENSKFSRLPVYKEDIDHIVGILHLKDFYGINGITTQPISEIMTPRTVVMALDKDMTVEKVFKENPNLNFSRIPVYSDTIDNIVGIVRRRDIITAVAGDRNNAKISDFMQPPIFVPENGSALSVMRQLIKKHQQMGIVVDEFASLTGVVTLEDIFEHLLGSEIFEADDIAVDMRELARNRKSRK